MGKKSGFGIGRGALVLLASQIAACSTPGGWQGAEAEKAYDKAAAAASQSSDKAAAVVAAENNDDYYQVHHAGRIYAFSDFKDYQIWRQTGEVPLVVTHIGAGPNGETVKMQLNKEEAKAMETTVGFKGAAQRMFEGELLGKRDAFYGEIFGDSRVYVFEDGADLQAFQSAGHVACGITQIGAGPDGKSVVFAQSCENAAKRKPDAAMARFKQNYGSR